MRVLLLHPEDSPDGGVWSRERWDLVVDLGFAGPETYTDWRRKVNCRVLSIHEFAGQTESYRWVNQVLERGRGRLIDRQGLDWWELLAMERYQDLHLLYLFRQLQKEICDDRLDVAASGPHRSTKIAEQALRVQIRYFQSTSAGPLQRATRVLRSARNLRPAQIVEIAFDKWDPSYQLRRYWTKSKRAGLAEAAVLLPTAYSNVTRSALAYAAQLPNRRFLLVPTRRNAISERVPGNVTVSPLPAYSCGTHAAQEEATELQKAWHVFRGTMLSESDEFGCAEKAGVWDYFPAHLKEGMNVREAWNELLDSEPMTGVLCGDDLNYRTRLPLMLAQRRDLNAVYCSHGALDGGFLFKVPSADSYLVKGEMERDYLRRVSTLAPEKIVIGAPGRNVRAGRTGQAGGALVFFSQPYEVAGGRTDSIYRELLPRLCSAARRSGRKVVVKLHPFESKRARQALVNSILPATERNDVEVVGAMPPGEVMALAWCGITIDSSVAVECALREIPFFLCGWLDYTGMGYLQQFVRFGVAHVLNAPEEIERIPEKVADYRPDPTALQRLWQEADTAQLDEIMSGTRQPRLRTCAC